MFNWRLCNDNSVHNLHKGNSNHNNTMSSIVITIIIMFAFNSLWVTVAASDMQMVSGEKEKRSGSSSLRNIDLFARRSALDKNFMRFGRAGNDNFMRFGRAKDKYDNFLRLGRATNFMRFGRRNDNFMRFGRAGADKDNNFIRFGRTKFEDDYDGFDRDLRRNDGSNYLRFGRGYDNYMRFGRDSNDVKNDKSETELKENQSVEERGGEQAIGSDNEYRERRDADAIVSSPTEHH